MLLLQFSTSHYCRKARLALGYKKIDYRVENLTPGLHVFKIKPLTGLTTLPVLIPPGQAAIADSTQIFHFLDSHCPQPSLALEDPQLDAEVWAMENWLDESIGIATRFVYYAFRAGEGKSINSSPISQLIVQTVRWQYGISPVRAKLAASRLECALELLAQRWRTEYLVGDRPTAADLAAAALLSPLALIPSYRQNYPWLFDRIVQFHQLCGEALPPGLESGLA